MAALSFQWPTASNRPGLDAGGHRQRLTSPGLPIPHEWWAEAEVLPSPRQAGRKGGPRLLALRGGGRDRDQPPPPHRSLFYECFCIIIITIRPLLRAMEQGGCSTGEGREETGSIVRDW